VVHKPNDRLENAAVARERGARAAHGRGRLTPRARLRPEVVLVLGLVAAALVAATAALDFGDPGDALRARVARTAEAEAELVRLDFERRLAQREPLAPPLGDVLAVSLVELGVEPAPGRESSPTAVGGVASAEGSGVFETLLRAAMAAGVEGATERALALLADALAQRTEDTPLVDVAEAHLRGLAWAAHLGRSDEVESHRAALLDLPSEVERRGIPYRLLAALAGPVDVELIHDVHAALVGETLALPAAKDTIGFDSRNGLQILADPTLSALHAAASTRAPALDWDAAFRRPERDTRAVAAWLAESAGLPVDALPLGIWTFVTPRELDTASDLLWAVHRTETTLQMHATTRTLLAAALEEQRAARVSGRDSRLAEVHIGAAPASEVAAEHVLLGPEALGASGLGFVVTSPSLEAELTRERRRLLAVRGGLVGLGLLIAATALLAARALAREQRLAELRTTFVASVSHDLRTPLASILLLVDNLQHGRVATEVARERYYDSLRQETERLRRMVEDLLDASRVERGQGARVARVRTDTATYLDELERTFVERAALVGAHVAVTRETLPAEVHIDPDAVRRAVWNLFENALRHGKRAGEHADVRVLVRADADARALIFEVADSGPGVPAKHREAIFAPFERLVDRRVERGQRRDLADDTGTGLGLAIVRAIARAHGGDAELVASDDTPGARFRLTVSVSEPEEAGPGAEGAA
jgi:signal transduction histidine kinase